MKNQKFFLAPIITLVLLVSVFAQQQDPIDKGINNYMMALNSKNDGLIESAVINIMKLKMVYPERDYTKVIQGLDQLTRSTPNRAIRYEAFVVLRYLEYPERFTWIRTDNDQQIDNLLANLVFRIHEQTDGVR